MSASSLRREIEVLLGLTGLQAANFWRAAATPAALPPGPVPIPYPNIAVGTPISVPGASGRFDGNYFVAGVSHRYGKSHNYGKAFDELAECVLAAAAGNDLAAQRIEPTWLRVKRELGRQPAHVRIQLGHELTHTLQQRGGRP